ncbi:ankyrin repeat domain-containing protein [Pseudomarimonas arenosa]|uniref:Ankyrin repeat domain-containing protein n=1 Tax=Pseudomarimonas arenosa TaxID=2774145 RepID=A0AAW3ZRC6_9GAMM|nr:ankyrin repeat domain-containing protein [Pseudomarimonas arenosa]MBD8528019.1 ankyrin repeat domain-containing protein [Pseudomarimonas arenosa]
MGTLEDVLKSIGDACEFSSIDTLGPNTRGAFSVRPLHVAAIRGDCVAIRTLVYAGAEINCLGEHGFSPLMEAAAQGHVDACKLLIELGAKSLPNEAGQVPSEYAEVSGYSELAAWLAGHGF